MEIMDGINELDPTYDCGDISEMDYNMKLVLIIF